MNTIEMEKRDPYLFVTRRPVVSVDNMIEGII
jgi:hypothetical protein